MEKREGLYERPSEGGGRRQNGTRTEGGRTTSPEEEVEGMRRKIFINKISREEEEKGRTGRVLEKEKDRRK